MGYKIERLVEEARRHVGYIEKKTNDSSMIYDKTANAGYNEYNMFAKFFDEVMPGWQNGRKNTSWCGWCAVLVDYCFVKAFGSDAALKLLCIPGKGSVNFSASPACLANYFKAKKQYTARSVSNPKAGDIIFFNPSSPGSSTITHVGIVVGRAENGKVLTVEGNTSRSEDMPYNGGCCREKCYWTYDTHIVGYGHPEYGEQTAEPPEMIAPVEPETPAEVVEADPVEDEITVLSFGAQGDAIKEAQEMLTDAGYSCCADVPGVYGVATLLAVLQFQLDAELFGKTGMLDSETVKALRKAVVA